MSELRVHPARGLLNGHVTVPGDKSIGHRALLFSLLTDAPLEVEGLGDGADNGRSARAAQALGVEVRRDGGRVRLTGPGLRGLRAPGAAVDCGNSGTTIRLLCGLLAGQPFATELGGDASLSQRPMRRVADPLRAMGAVLRGVGQEPEAAELVPPLVVGPCAQPLRGIRYDLPMASAQVKSAVLLAALSAEGDTVVREPGPSRDHTERMLRHMGAPIEVDGATITVRTGGWDRRLGGGRVVVPGDPSSAAFLVAAALVVGAGEVILDNVLVNPTRTGYLEALAAMGAHIEVMAGPIQGGEPVATLRITGPAPGLRGTAITGGCTVRAIDEIPILAVVAAFAAGETVVGDAEELRVKESDRIATTVAMLRGFGVMAEPTADGLRVCGGAGQPLRGAHVHAHGDHRIAMAAAVAGLRADGETRIEDAGNVVTSYPGFVDDLRRLGAEVEWQA